MYTIVGENTFFNLFLHFLIKNYGNLHIHSSLTAGERQAQQTRPRPVHTIGRGHDHSQISGELDRLADIRSSSVSSVPYD